MAKYAFIRNATVILVEEIESSEYTNHIKDWDAIINVEALPTLPAPGWVMYGNAIVPVDPEEQQRVQQFFGANLALELVNMVGAKNLALASQGEVVNVSSLLTNLMSVKMLLETGALKTARSLCGYYKPQYATYSHVFQHAITKVSEFLALKGWE